MSFHLEYRPEDLDEVFGNESTIKELRSLLSKKGKPSAYLLVGPTGCGKTTLARIMAKHFGCVGMDLLEVNASNNRGIDTAREISNLISLHAACGKSRVVILDEVHMATKDFQNALLKPMEDTPANVFFILCTTNPEGLIDPLKNRCVKFEVKPLVDKEMKELIETVVEAEKKSVPASTTDAIIAVVEGCPRQALIILEKVINLPWEEHELIAISSLSSSTETIQLCRLLAKRAHWKEVAEAVKLLTDDPERARRAILGYFTTILLSSYGPKADFAALVIEEFEKSFYYSGKPSLVKACYIVTGGK